jgi:hypothetical protein
LSDNDQYNYSRNHNNASTVHVSTHGTANVGINHWCADAITHNWSAMWCVSD